MACRLLRSARPSSAIFSLRSDTHSWACSEMEASKDGTHLRRRRTEHGWNLAGVSSEDAQLPVVLQLLSVVDSQVFDPAASLDQGLQSSLNTFALLSAQLLLQTFSEVLQRRELKEEPEAAESVLRPALDQEVSSSTVKNLKIKEIINHMKRIPQTCPLMYHF